MQTKFEQLTLCRTKFSNNQALSSNKLNLRLVDNRDHNSPIYTYVQYLLSGLCVTSPFSLHILILYEVFVSRLGDH